MKNVRRIITIGMIIFLIFFYAYANSFSLKVAASSYVPSLGAMVNFICVPSGGVPPYHYAWDFDDIDSNKNPSMAQNPSHTFKWVGSHIVTVTVTDATSAMEQGLLIIDVRGNPGVVKSAKTDCGCKGDGVTDDGPALRACIERFSPDKGGRIEFPAGTYLIGDTESGVHLIEGRSGIMLKYIRKVELVGIGAAQPTLLFQVSNNYDNDGKYDTFFSYDPHDTDPQYLLVQNLHLNYDLMGRAQTDYDAHYLIDGFLNFPDAYVAFENCVIKNYTGIGLIGQIRFRKNTVLNWGMPDNSECIYLQGNSLFKHNYIAKGSDGHSHLIYSGGTSTGANRDFVFIIENYLDGTSGYDNAWGLHFYGEDGSILQHKYVWGNLIKGTTMSAIIMGILGGPQFNSQHIEITNNIFVDKGINIWKSHADVVIQNNFFQNIDDFCLHVGKDSSSEEDGIIFTNNTMGSRAGVDGKGTIEFVADQYGEIFAPNRDDASSVDITDPGPWEYQPPANVSVSINNGADSTALTEVTLSLSASDAGSGMESRPRFPFKQGGLMQFSNDRVAWSEVRLYMTSTSWKLDNEYGKKTVFARFRDVAGNWSEPVSDTIVLTVGNPPAPKNLRIVR